MNLKDIFCQDSAIGSLQRAYAASRMAHAYIFAGPDGVGRFAVAQAWARMLLCQDKVENKDGSEPFFDSCGQCQSCGVFDGGGHPDFKHVHKELVRYTKDGKNKKTPIDMPKDVIDEFLIDKVAIKPQMGRTVVFVVQEAEKLNKSSQNALLKVLEEPPGHCVIIMLCSMVDSLLPTTLSRCQVIRFGQIDTRIIVDKLAERGVSAEEALYWARFSDGSIGEAIGWAGLELKESTAYQIKRDLVERLCRQNAGETIEFAEWLVARARDIAAGWTDAMDDVSKLDIGRRAQKGLLRMMIGVFGDAMRIAAGIDAEIVNSDHIPHIRAIALRMNVERLGELVALGYEKMRWIDASVNEKLIFEELLLNFNGCATIRDYDIC